MFYIDRRGKLVEVYGGYADKKRIRANTEIEANEEEVFNPKYLYEKLELKELDTLASNPGWKVNVNYAKYCLEKKNKYRRHIEKLKKLSPQAEKKQMFPKLR